MNLSTLNSVKLTPEQWILVEARLANQKKSTTVVFLLWGVLGFFGAHDFYFHRVKYAILKDILFVMLIVTFLLRNVLFVLLIIFVSLLLWWICDGFLLKARIQKDTQQKRQEIIQEVLSNS